MSQNEVTVHVNRSATDTLEVDAGTFETRDSFTLVLQGHETPAHVHCRLNDADSDSGFSRIVSIAGPNYYVEPNERIAVPISVAATDIDEPIEGELEVLTGYGSESVTIDVIVKPKPSAVEVDESLATPRQTEQPADTTLEKLLERVPANGPAPGTIAVVGLGLLAVAIATSTAATIGGPAAMVGLVIVCAGVAAALLLLVR